MAFAVLIYKALQGQHAVSRGVSEVFMSEADVGRIKTRVTFHLILTGISYEWDLQCVSCVRTRNDTCSDTKSVILQIELEK